MKKLISLLLVIFAIANSNAQSVSINAGADTTICLGTSATLNATLTPSTFTFNQTSTYQIQNMAFAPEPYTGTNAGLYSDDQVYGPFAIGFPFCFFGNSYTQCYIGTNGWLGFSGAPGGGTYDPWVTTTIPNTGTGTPKNCIFGPWKDWYPTTGPTPGQYVRYTTTGTAPNRKFILTYQNMPMFSCTSTYSTFQIVLHETTNIIDNHLTNVTVCNQWNSGNGVQGLHNLNGTTAIVVPGRNNTPWTAQNESKKYVPNGPPINSTITWYQGTSVIGTGPSITVTPTITTTYKAQVTVCTTFFDNVVVNVAPCGYLTASTTNVNCYGQSTGEATVNIYDGVPPYTYTWSNGTVVANSSSNSSTITGIPAGTYNCVVSMFNGAYSLDTTLIITENPQMSLTEVSNTPEACAVADNGTLTIQLTNGVPSYFYAISPTNQSPSNSSTFTFTGLDAGAYLVTVTDIYGCTVIDNFTIGSLPQMTMNLSSIAATCPQALDGSLSVIVNNGTAPFTYFCSFVINQPTIQNNSYTFTNLDGGNYTVTVVDANGCSVVGVNQVSELQINSNVNTTPVNCYSGSDGAASVQISGGTQPYLYHWNTGSTTNSINNVSAGNYAVTVTDNHGCIIVVPLVIIEPDSIIITSSQDTTMCLTETATISASAIGGTSPYLFLWSNNQNGQSIQVSPTQTTTYNVYAVDQHGCESIETDVTVTLFPGVEIYPFCYVDSICAGDTTELFANFAGGNGGPYYCMFNDSIVEFPFNVAPQTTTVFTLIGKDFCGSPSGSGQVTVYVMNAPGSNIIVNNQKGCSPLKIIFTDPTPDNGQTYYWEFGDPYQTGFSVDRNPEHTYQNPGVYDVVLTTKSSFGCYSTVVYDDFITVNPTPEASFNANPTSASIFAPVIYFDNVTTNYLSSHWIFGDGGTSDFDDVQYTFKDTGTFAVRLIVVNSDACVDTTFRIIQITPEATFWAPNAFNPLSENEENTVFMPVGSGINTSDFHMIVYDRWGQKVFETFSVYHPWNGKLENGDFAQPGTYSWLVNYKDFSGKSVRKSGFVTLMN